MASFLQPVYNAIGLGDADLRAKVFYVTGFIASVSVIHFFADNLIVPIPHVAVAPAPTTASAAAQQAEKRPGFGSY